MLFLFQIFQGQSSVNFIFEMRSLLPAVALLFMILDRSYAPVPRCSPFIIINKIPESTSFGADFNPYFPVPGIPFEALP